MRKRRAVRRDVLPDPIYNSKLVTKAINALMLDGKKGTAQKIYYKAFEMVKEKTGEEPDPEPVLGEVVISKQALNENGENIEYNVDLINTRYVGEVAAACQTFF